VLEIVYPCVPGISTKASRFFCAVVLRTRERGYCWARNKHFEDLFQVNQTTISRWIRELKQLGLIVVHAICNNDRYIYLTPAGGEMAARIKEAEEAQKSRAKCLSLPTRNEPKNGLDAYPSLPHKRSSESGTEKNLKLTTTDTEGRAPRPSRPASPKASVVSVEVSLDEEQKKLLAALTTEGVGASQATKMVKDNPEAVKHNLAALKILKRQNKSFINAAGWLVTTICNDARHCSLVATEHKKAAAIKRVAKAEETKQTDATSKASAKAQIEALDADAFAALRARAIATLPPGFNSFESLIEARMRAIIDGSYAALECGEKVVSQIRP
jgi:hypothetical protein